MVIGWEELTAIGTCAMALTTVAMVLTTVWLIYDGRRQHRDKFRPICVLAPYDGVDDWDRRRTLITASGPTPEHQGYGSLAIHCCLRNVGLGPALKLRIRFRFLDMNGWMSDPWELSPLKAGETLGGKAAPLIVPFWIREDFNLTTFGQFEGKSWEIWLTYEDTFGQQFEAVHSKAAVDTDLSIAVWTDTGKAIFPTIPWHRHEGPTHRRADV